MGTNQTIRKTNFNDEKDVNQIEVVDPILLEVVKEKQTADIEVLLSKFNLCRSVLHKCLHYPLPDEVYKIISETLKETNI